MKIIVAPHAGTCFGVNNAIKIAFEAADRYKAHILGELVHNPQIVQKLADIGVKTILDIKDLNKGDNLIIRAHGEPKEVYEYCKKNQIQIIDCTCPFVKKAQNLAASLESEGYKVLLVGDEKHPEVRGIAAQTNDPIIVQSPNMLNRDDVKDHHKLGILSQTTQNKKNFREIIQNVLDLPSEIKIHNTICNATTNRQEAALKLSDDVDIMLVIGGKNSANTKRLFEICKEKIKTYWITDTKEIEKSWFNDYDTVGITAGASTPEEIIGRVKEHLDSLKFQ